MNIQLSINFDYTQKLVVSKEQNELFQSFYDYCSENSFEYQSVPRIGEMIDVEDIMWKWAEQHDGTATKDTVLKLRKMLYRDLRVYNVVHSRESISVWCTDMYQLD